MRLQTVIIRYLPIVAAAAGSAAFLAACDTSVGVQAQTSSVAPAFPTPASSTDLGALNPCETVDEVIAGQGMQSAAPTVADPRRSCHAAKNPAVAEDSLDVGLLLQDEQSYRDSISNPSQASPGTVGSRAAVEEREPVGAKGQCSIAIEVRPNSRALISVSVNSDTDKAFKTAEGLADKLEPLLPKNT
jgi:hypothetical protein